MLQQFSDIKHIVYINLESRTDRKEHVVAELNKLGIDEVRGFTRFNAVKLPTGNGALGCSMSHLKCLEMAKKNEWSHVLICEDDIVFLDPALFISQINAFLSKSHSWDVLLLAGNNMLPYSPFDNTCIQVMHCLTTTGYIVQNHYFDTLIDHFKTGLLGLLKEPNKHIIFALDQYWKILQKKDTWYLIIPLSVIQKDDYSNIENKYVNYSRYANYYQIKYI